MTNASVYRPGKAGTLAGTFGAGAAIAAALSLAAPEIMRWEGERTVTYRDVAGIPTACYGHTGADVGRVGTRWTDGQCRVLLNSDVQTHMAGVLRCVPGLVTRPGILAATTILSFNIGDGAFCRSAIARRFRAGDWRGGCDGFALWTRAGGQVVPGLVRRRAAERAICLKGA